MSYISEFPNYDGDFYCPDGWIDASYHNDVCPHIMKQNEKLGVSAYVWEDYVDPKLREYEEGKRYIFEIRLDERFDYIFGYATDSLLEIRNLVKGVTI